MALLVQAASSDTFNDGLTPSGLDSRVNAILSTLLTVPIKSVFTQCFDKQRRTGKVLECQVAWDDTVTGTVLTSPFKVVSFTGATQADVQAQADAYRTANAAWWFGVPIYRYIPEFTSNNNQPHVLTQPYCEDAVGAPDNWQVDGGAGGGGAELTADVTAALTVGAIDAGETLPAGTSFQQFVEALLVTTFYPTFIAPSATLTDDQPSSMEVGSLINITLTLTLNRGAINGDLVGGVWNPAVAQDFRSGPANDYTIDGVSGGLVNTRLINGVTIVAGANTWGSTVSYDQGPQPLDSDGNNYDVPLAAGSLSPNNTIQGYRNAFYGTSAAVSPVAPANSAEVRAFAGTLLNPQNGSSFVINIPIGATMVVFAYPETLQDVTSVLYAEGFDADVKGVFTQTIVSVEGANGYAAVNYKVYTYIPVAAFSDTATYTVTI